MSVKPYKTQKDETQQLHEPAVPYQSTREPAGFPQKDDSFYQVTAEEQTSILRSKEQYARGEYFTQQEVDKIVSEWLD